MVLLLLCSDLNLWSKIAANPTRLSSGGMRYIFYCFLSHLCLDRLFLLFVRKCMQSVKEKHLNVCIRAERSRVVETER